MTRIYFFGFSLVSALYLAGCAEVDEPTGSRTSSRTTREYGYRGGGDRSTTTTTNQSRRTTTTSGNVRPDVDDDGTTSSETTTTRTTPSDETVSTTPPAGNYPVGTPVPGKPGFVTSPHAPASGYVDVRGFPPGTEVKDPYTQKIFLVP